MITRTEYMQNWNTREGHRAYFAQFVTPAIKQKILRTFGLSNLIASFKENEHFNTDITPLRRWDAIHLFTSTDKHLRECGDYLTLDTQVCILKEAARQIVEEHKQEVKA